MAAAAGSALGRMAASASLLCALGAALLLLLLQAATADLTTSLPARHTTVVSVAVPALPTAVPRPCTRALSAC